MDEVQYRYTPGERQFLLYRFLLENTKSKPTNASQVASREQVFDYLLSYGIEIDRKTLYTDFDVLRATMKCDVDYHRSLRGYYVKNPPFEPYEMRLLVDSVQASKFITQEKAREITNKLKQYTDRHTRATLNRQAYVSDRIRSMNDSVVKDADRLHEAIETDRKISFLYTHHHPDKSKPKTYSKQGERLTVSPYALLWNNGNYYLYAYDGKKFRYYRVDRMERIGVPSLEKRDGKKEFDAKNLTTHKAKVFDMYGGKAFTVNMRFRNELCDAVIDRFGKDISMIPVDNEHFTITVPVEVSPPFYAWVATFGRRVKILGPDPVIEGMKKFIAAVSDMYKDAGDV